MFVNKYEKMDVGSVDGEMFQLNKVNQALWDQQKETKDIFGEIKSRNSPYKTQKKVDNSLSPKQLESKLDSDLINSKQKEIQLMKMKPSIHMILNPAGIYKTDISY